MNVEKVDLVEKNQCNSASFPNSPALPLDGILQKTRSQGGTPVLGSEESVLPTWKSGPPTPVQGLSPNSTAITLLVGFAQGNVQMQGNSIKHFQEGNLPRLRDVTIELLEPATGRVIGSIPDVNFVEGLDQMATEEMIGEMLNQIDPTYNES